MLWVDKHRPTSLSATDYHASLANQLRALAAARDFPHLLVYGPPGAGKKTRVAALLRAIYGSAVDKVRRAAAAAAALRALASHKNFGRLIARAHTAGVSVGGVVRARADESRAQSCRIAESHRQTRNRVFSVDLPH